MNITFLIGNGFDLNIGLKTGYSDFIDWFNKGEFEDSNGSIKELHDSIQEYCDKKKLGEPFDINWSDTELAFGQFTNKFVDSNNGDVSVEECHTLICGRLSEYLREEEKKFPVQKIKENKELLGATAKSIYAFTKGLRIVDAERLTTFINSIGNGYNVDFIDFNYTNIIDQLIPLIKEKNLVGKRTYRGTEYNNVIKMPIHVHGKLSHGLVFGLDNENQINSTVFSDDEPERMRAIIKKYYNEDMGEGIDKKVLATIHNSNIIYIYGMSIGMTDQRWWEVIVNKLKNDTASVLIIHNLDVPQITLSPAPYMRYCRLNKDKFLKFNPNLNSDEKDKIKDRIFFTGANIFSDLENIVISE